MTRETKIGLLVGLAFIIVIGILLSDHFASTMQPPPAVLMGATESVIRSTATPGARQVPGGEVNLQVQPDRTIPIGQSPAEGQARIVVGPGQSANRPIEIRGVNDQPPVQDRNLLPPPDDRRADQQTTPAGLRQYTAEPGDTVSRMAGRLLGKNTKANRDAIIAANPSLQKDSNRVFSGQVYLIPVKVETPVAGETRATPPPVTPPTTPPPVAELIYTTKSGDNLWRIAVEQVGSGSAVAQIRELNKDLLKGSDRILPNMKLRLPPKQVASAE